MEDCIKFNEESDFSEDFSMNEAYKSIFEDPYQLFSELNINDPCMTKTNQSFFDNLEMISKNIPGIPSQILTINLDRSAK